MFTYEVAETELDASEGMVSGAESEKADDQAESLQWFAASSLRHLSTDLEPLQLPLATSAPHVPLECTPARLLPSALRHDHLELIFFTTSETQACHWQEAECRDARHGVASLAE